MEVLGLVEKAMNIRAFYHKVLAGNVANVETPHYKEKDIDFNRALETNMRKVEDIQVGEKEDYNGLNSTDGNTVNMEDQVTKLTENNLYFNSLTKIMTKKFAVMRYIITEGKGG
ncbi:MAG TPA: flagellar basal body rod protein FlgB [Syntrophorhabdaceae bacterium]|jgi:flagellar basal-body rod protein FlgB